MTPNPSSPTAEELKAFYDRHHEEWSGDFATVIDERPDCECVPCQNSRGLIKHLQGLATQIRDEHRTLREALDGACETIHSEYCGIHFGVLDKGDHHYKCTKSSEALSKTQPR